MKGTYKITAYPVYDWVYRNGDIIGIDNRIQRYSHTTFLVKNPKGRKLGEFHSKESAVRKVKDLGGKYRMRGGE